MNERIKELEKQCFEYHADGQVNGFNVGKFAELIVKECSLVCKMNPHFDNYQLANIVKIHFGVEE